MNSLDALVQAKASLEADGVNVVGPVDHTLFKSIYFFDPNGHRLELAFDCGTSAMYHKLDEVKGIMLDEWAATKKAPAHASWMHDGSHRT